LPNGQVVVTSRDATTDLVRFDADGSLDAAFGSNGAAPLATVPHAPLGGLALTSDRRYLVGGGESFAPDPGHPILELQRYVDSIPPNAPFALTAVATSATAVQIHLTTRPMRRISSSPAPRRARHPSTS
jgi:hypothetical protein